MFVSSPILIDPTSPPDYTIKPDARTSSYFNLAYDMRTTRDEGTLVYFWFIIFVF
jgi:hypothetical protein